MASRARVSFHDFQPDAGSFLDDVMAGLAQPQKTLNPKYFYDSRGCELFEAICRLPEYYPTRTEMAIMRESALEIAQHLGRGCVLIEYGSGSSRKTEALIADIAPAVYVPIDIAAGQLKSSAERLAALFPDLEIAAICADYTRELMLPGTLDLGRARRVVFFPGSTIGNFMPDDARRFLRNARGLAGPGGAMLVGVDLKKDPGVLHAAYNDAQGVTAAFNLNLLARINRELGADFDLDAFRHRAFYNVAAGRIEMHLASMREQQVNLNGRRFFFRENETIHTENSYKYSVAEFQALAREAGFSPECCWIDAAQLFSVHCLSVPS
jgi:dimethylhistidine N-methyltransferase